MKIKVTPDLTRQIIDILTEVMEKSENLTEEDKERLKDIRRKRKRNNKDSNTR